MGKKEKPHNRTNQRGREQKRDKSNKCNKCNKENNKDIPEMEHNRNMAERREKGAEKNRVNQSFSVQIVAINVMKPNTISSDAFSTIQGPTSVHRRENRRGEIVF